MSNTRIRTRSVSEPLEGRRLLATLPTGFVETNVNAAVLSSATAMQFAPDGKLYIAEQGGTLEVYQGSGSGTWAQVAPNSNLLSRASNNANHISVNSSGERGLLGLAFDPGFTSNRFLYIYYTTSTSPIHNRVSRFTVNAAGTQVIENSETVLVDLDNLSGATNHNGGAMNFGADGKLYVAVGENANPANAQSIGNRLGKILRYNPDGTIPSDNPTSIAGIAGTTAGANRAIWAAGVRNPFTFTVHPTTGTIYINDVGQNDWEEINIGTAGSNYGWSTTEGRFNQASFPSFTNPIVAYPHTTSLTPYPTNNGGNYSGFAITGGAFYVSPNPVFPSDYTGDYFYADYVSNFIRRFDSASNSTIAFATNAGAPVDLKTGPDGRLYYLSRTNGRVVRVDFTGSAAPYVLEQPANRSVAAGQTATFSVQAGGPGTLSYQWQRGTTDIAGATGASYAFTVAPGDDGATFRVRVSNATGSVFSNAASLAVTANQPPVPTLLTPTVGTKFSYGTMINYSDSATDAEDGTITNGSQFSWRVSYFTNIVERPFVPETPGAASGSFTIPAISPYTLPDVYYRIYLTVTDSFGNTTTTSRDLQPNTAQVTLASTPGNGTVLLDGASQTTPTTFTGVTGQTRSLEAPATFTASGQTYNFVNWSDGGARLHDISTPSANTTYTAVYQDVTLPAFVGAAFDRDRRASGLPPHALTFTFSEPVTTMSAALTLLNTTTGQTIPVGVQDYELLPATNQIRWSFAQLPGGILPGGNYTATLDRTLVSDAGNNSLAANAVTNFRFLLGDADDNGSANFSDLVILAQNYNLPGKTFSQGNFDYSTDGLVGFQDLVILAQHYNTSLSTLSTLTLPGEKPAARAKRPVGDVLA